jgi:hypothetical protein
MSENFYSQGASLNKEPDCDDPLLKLYPPCTSNKNNDNSNSKLEVVDDTSGSSPGTIYQPKTNKKLTVENDFSQYITENNKLRNQLILCNESKSGVENINLRLEQNINDNLKLLQAKQDAEKRAIEERQAAETRASNAESRDINTRKNLIEAQNNLTSAKLALQNCSAEKKKIIDENLKILENFEEIRKKNIEIKEEIANSENLRLRAEAAAFDAENKSKSLVEELQTCNSQVSQIPSFKQQITELNDGLNPLRENNKRLENENTKLKSSLSTCITTQQVKVEEAERLKLENERLKTIENEKKTAIQIAEARTKGIVSVEENNKKLNEEIKKLKTELETIKALTPTKASGQIKTFPVQTKPSSDTIQTPPKIFIYIFYFIVIAIFVLSAIGIVYTIITYLNINNGDENKEKNNKIVKDLIIS